MKQILMQEQLSFDHKMSNIQNTNNILDQLEKKMNSYFHKNFQQERNMNTQMQNNNSQESKLQANDYAQPYRKSSNNRRLTRDNVNDISKQPYGSFDVKKRQLQFKQFSQVNYKISDADLIPDFRDNQTTNTKMRNQQINEEHIKQKQRISQSNSLTNEQTMQNQASYNNRGRKSNDEFRLIGKSREALRQRESKQDKRQQSLERLNFSKNKKTQINQLKFRQTNHKDERLQDLGHPLNLMNINKTNKGVISSMENIEVVMKEALDAKLRKIKQIQCQIMTQNQERVYLYKVNVRLNEELKHLQQQQQSQEIANSKNIEWILRNLQQDIEKAKKQLNKKKNQQKQLKKEEKTLRDGYETVLNNKKNLLRKDIQNYMDRQNKNRENTEMLKGLMKELDKLKGVVESKIKINSKNNQGTEKSNNRKVIKSFKN